MSRQQSTIQHAATTNGIIPPKPKRPLTVFNLFSILERNFFVQHDQKRASDLSNTPTDMNTDPYLATRPERYRDVVLPPNWYVVGMNRVKRSKHKVHGVISFNDLTKEISNRWKSVDADTKHYCEMIAADELERYRRDMAAYKAIYGKDAAKAHKQTPKTHSRDTVLNVDFLSHCANTPCVSRQQKYTQSQATGQTNLFTCTPFRAQTNASYFGDTNVPINSACSRNHSPTLSDYLPDDQEAALALVGNNYDNILHGEELEKTFDSD